MVAVPIFQTARAAIDTLNIDAHATVGGRLLFKSHRDRVSVG